MGNEAPTGTTWEVWEDGLWRASVTTAEQGEKELQYWRQCRLWKEKVELVRVDRTRIASFDVRDSD